MKSMGAFIVVAALSLVVGIGYRLVGRYAFLDLTPSAFLRFADTMLLFAIATGLYLIVRRKKE
ncbi:MAG: hypothetical protein ACE5JA_02400 [bacterium]